MLISGIFQTQRRKISKIRGNTPIEIMTSEFESTFEKRLTKAFEFKIHHTKASNAARQPCGALKSLLPLVWSKGEAPKRSGRLMYFPF